MLDPESLFTILLYVLPLLKAEYGVGSIPFGVGLGCIKKSQRLSLSVGLICLCPREELNLDPHVRSVLFYPLNYEGLHWTTFRNIL
jgi:hypothetical protein